MNVIIFKNDGSRKNMKKLTAIVLTVVMALCSITISAYAMSEKPFYLVLGDSIAYGSGISNSREACYGRIVADTNGYDYANHAIPGHTTNNLINRLKEETVIADLEKADIISISIGGNDFLMSNLFGLMFDSIVRNDYTQFDRIADGFYTNFCEIVRIINSHNEDAVILMQTIYNPQTGYIGEAYQQGADRINAQIWRFAEENPGEIVVVDVATALGDDALNYADDEIHPSAQGNEIIAETVLAKLFDLGLGTDAAPVIAEKGKDIRISPIFTMPFRLLGNLFHYLSFVYGFFN